MKNFTYIITVLLVTLSCSAQEEPAIENNAQKLLSEADQAYLNVLIGPDWNQGVVVGNAFHNDEASRPETPALFEARYGIFTAKMHGPERLSWKEADEIIRSHFDPVLGESENFTAKEIRYTASLQSTSTKFLKHYLIKEEPSKELAEHIEYYLEVLYRHQGKTLYVITDAMEHARPFLKKKDYKKYRSYITQQVAANMKEVEDKWQEYYHMYKTSEHWERAKYLHRGKRLQNMTEEAQYIQEKLGSNF